MQNLEINSGILSEIVLAAGQDDVVACDQVLSAVLPAATHEACKCPYVTGGDGLSAPLVVTVDRACVCV